MYLVTAQEMRELDRLTIEAYGTPGHVLMERAGAGATEALLREFPHVRQAPVLVVAGKGNNGGDGFVIARLLKKQGVKCEVVLAADRAEVRGDARRNLSAFLRLRGRVTEVTEPSHLGLVQEKLSQSGLVVDALLGTGLNSPVRGLMAALIDLINASGVPVVAVDIPSGLDADRGEPLDTAIQAELTVTFAYPKLGQVSDAGAPYVGRLVVVDIGIAPDAVAAVKPRTVLLTAEGVGALVRERRRTAHKGDFGHLLVLAGARGKSGAALLCGGAALRVGTGLVTLAGPSSLNAIFSSVLIEAMTVPFPERADGSLALDEGALASALQGKNAVAFGPGVGVSTDTIGLTRWLLAHSELPLVIDADGLNCLATDLSPLRDARGPVILTPHPGEMARLVRASTAEVQSQRLALARAFATQHHCYLVLKGSHTVIAAPDGGAWVNTTGNPGMASGGMGDVLTGILAGLLAQGYAAAEACALGVFLHGYAGDLAAGEKGEAGIVARDVIERLPGGLRALRQAALEDCGAGNDA
ncbi:MAG TPA: NAD(P)H-hydrate dehydratase [Candidatus Binatia bacterium]|nr:NAD(P)H-hydrate dehydratase [Candidatus Binatia bacterium]